MKLAKLENLIIQATKEEIGSYQPIFLMFEQEKNVQVAFLHPMFCLSTIASSKEEAMEAILEIFTGLVD